MTIYALPTSGLRFTDAHGIFRRARGVALSQRLLFRRLYGDAIARYTCWLEEESTEFEVLWADKTFASTCIQILDLTHIRIDWLISEQVNLIPNLLLTYINDEGEELQGDLGAWELPTLTPPSKTQASHPAPCTLQKFDSLIIEDIHQGLFELFPLPCSYHQRFQDLLELMKLRLSDRTFHDAYDRDRVFARCVNESLALFDLAPSQVSAAMACELLISDWIEPQPGHYQPIPGWLDQLCNPPIEYESKGKPLTKGENPYDALIASMWGDGGLRSAIADANALPFPQLRSILYSRNRMIEEMINESKGARSLMQNNGDSKYTAAEKQWLDSIDYDQLMEELKKAPTPVSR